MSGLIDKEFRPLVKRLKKLPGFELRKSKGNNHVACYYQGKRVGSLPTSSGDFRAVRAFRRQLREHGVDLPV